MNANLRSHIERKVSYVSGDAVSVTATGQVISATGNIARGDGAVNNMTGNLLTPTRWRLRFTFSTAQAFSTVRILVFQWLDSSIPTASDLLQLTGDARAPHSPLLWINIHKIRVLRDFVTALVPRSTGGSDATYHEIDMPGMSPLQFSSTLSPQMNGLYMLLISDDIIGTAPQLTYTSELVFTDA